MYMLRTVLKTVIVFWCTSFTAPAFGKSAQLLSRNHLFSYAGGGAEGDTDR